MYAQCHVKAASPCQYCKYPRVQTKLIQYVRSALRVRNLDWVVSILCSLEYDIQKAAAFWRLHIGHRKHAWFVALDVICFRKCRSSADLVESWSYLSVHRTLLQVATVVWIIQNPGDADVLVGFWS